MRGWQHWKIHENEKLLDKKGRYTRKEDQSGRKNQIEARKIGNLGGSKKDGDKKESGMKKNVRKKKEKNGQGQDRQRKEIRKE